MKRVIAWVLILTLCLGLFAGCKKKDNIDTTSSVADLEAALEYVKTVYKKPSEKTPKDFQRIGNVPVNGKNYEVVWSADVSEDNIKIIKGTDGMVTIDVNENVKEDVKYVLTATISDDAGHTVSHGWNHLLPAAGNMLSIVEDAYALKPGEAMDYEVTLTGKITVINTPWDAGYKNITVTIVVEGAEDKPIQCYRLKGDGADKLKPNDIITVTGKLKNYNGTIEFDAGCTLDAVIEGEEIKAPTDPKQIVKEAYALKENQALPYEATLTGKITKVDKEYDPGYKNVSVIMVVDGMDKYPILCYRLAGDGADKIGKGDTITVKGYITNYKGTIEFAQGCKLVSWKDTGVNEPKPEDTFTTTLVPEVVTNPQVGVAYKLFMYQKNYDKNFYMNGEMDGFYYATTYDPAKAVDVFVEEVSGGYRLYFMKGGAKNYLEVLRQYSSSTSKYHNNVVFSANPTAVWKWNDAIKSFIITVEVEGTPTNFYLGTYSFYKTFSASDVSRITGDDVGKMDTENFVARLATMKETKVTPEEKAFEQLKLDYPIEGETAEVTGENYTRKNVYEFDGSKVSVTWTENSDAVAIVDNGDGTVTVQVTRGEADAPYTLTATIADGDKSHTTSWECIVPALPPVSAKDIVEAAYALEPGQSLADPVTLTGFVAGIGTPYSEQHGNITVTIVIEDMLDKPIECYRMKGDGIANLVGGEYITVTGIMKNYNGKIEFDAGCTMEACKTQAQIVDETYALESGKALDEKYILVGVVTSAGAYNAQHGNITVTMAVPGREDKPIQCYRLTGEGVDVLAEGYIVAVYGTLKNYNGTYEFDQGCVLLAYEEPVVEDDALFVPKPVSPAEVGKTYKFYMYQKNLDKNLYFAGGIANYGLSTTEDYKEAVDVTLEAVDGVDGAVRFYFMDGETKMYIELYKSGSYVNPQLVEATPTMYFTYDETAGTYVADIGGTNYYLGAYGTNAVIKPSKTSYITGEKAEDVGVSQFVARFATMAPAEEDVEPATPPVEFEKAYKFFMYQKNLEKALYFAGGIANYGLSTTDNLAEAVDVYVEDASSVATGAVRFYFMDGETKMYIELYKSGSYVNPQLVETTPTMYFTYDETAGTYVADIGGTNYYLGAYGSNAVIKPSKTYYITGENAEDVGVSQFVAQFGTVVVKEVGPAPVSLAEVGKTYKFYMYQKNLDKNLYFAGGIANYGLSTTEDYKEAVDVTLEAVDGVDGAVRFYFMDGETKMYIELYKSGSYVNPQLVEATPTMYFTYDETAGTYVADIGGTNYYLGAYGTNAVIKPSKTSYITGEKAEDVGVSQFVARFATIEFVEDIISSIGEE